MGKYHTIITEQKIYNSDHHSIFHRIRHMNPNKLDGLFLMVEVGALDFFVCFYTTGLSAIKLFEITTSISLMKPGGCLGRYRLVFFFFFFKLYCTPLLHASGSGLGTGRPMSKHYLLLYSHTRKDRVRVREREREKEKKKKRIVRDKIC